MRDNVNDDGVLSRLSQNGNVTDNPTIGLVNEVTREKMPPTGMATTRNPIHSLPRRRCIAKRTNCGRAHQNAQ